ncbi:Protoheme IX farnesyltransferase, mitochondrial, partial [Neophaeococcomyces mojaviensis]
MQLLPTRACSTCLAQLARPSASTRILYRSSIHTKRKLHGAIVPDQHVQRQMRIQPQSSFHDYFSANESIDRGWLKNGLLAVRRTTSRPETPAAIPVPSSEFKTAVVEEPVRDENEATVATPALSAQHVLPHRRRWLQRKAAAQHSIGEASQDIKDVAEEQLPLDASSRLTTTAAGLPQNATWRRKFATYLSLSKPRLSFLILLTTTSAYSLYPIPDIISSTTH